MIFVKGFSKDFDFSMISSTIYALSEKYVNKGDKSC